MSALEIILVVIVVGLAVALFYQMKTAKKQAEDGQQLLNDYQKRVDELQRLLEDYNSLSKNFENIGKDKDPDSVARLQDVLKKFDKL